MKNLPIFLKSIENGITLEYIFKLSSRYIEEVQL